MKFTDIRIECAWLDSLQSGSLELNGNWYGRRALPVSLADHPGSLCNLRRIPDRDYGWESGYYINRGSILHFVIDPAQYPWILWQERRLFVAGNFNGWSDAIGQNDWQLRPGGGNSRPHLEWRGSLDVLNGIETPEFKFVTDRGEWLEIPENAPNRTVTAEGIINFGIDRHKSGHHLFRFDLRPEVDLSQDLALLLKLPDHTQKITLRPGEFFYRLRSEQPLGAMVMEKGTQFRIFAPRAEEVAVSLFPSNSQAEELSWQPLQKERDGTWTVFVEGSHHSWNYWYRVNGPENDFCHFDPEQMILDPYALAAAGPLGPGLIIDLSKRTTRPKPLVSTPMWQDLIILEGHVRDLARNAPTTQSNHDQTGFRELASYVRSPAFYPSWLGVNAVELQPVQEYDGEIGAYHWGYMTCNFFAPASGYASDPSNGSQIDEFTDLVNAFHEKGIAVILDVVYNHVGEPAHLLFLDKLYYFHVNGDGSLSNWSGCGNDLRAESAMALRLIVDSLVHLVETFGVDGFRFDLAELLGKEALRTIERELKKIRPDLILIAEPWSFRGHIARSLRDTGYSSWNDAFREFAHSYVRGDGSHEAVSWFLRGSPGDLAAWPAQTVNYAESHDDLCWIDRITENPNQNGESPSWTDIRRTHLLFAFLMGSIGIPMLHSGQDHLHSKRGVHNTYRRGDLNALNYQRILQYPATARYLRGWIQFRLSPEGSFLRHFSRRADSFFSFHFCNESNALAVIYNADGTMGTGRWMLALNPYPRSREIELAHWSELAWEVIGDQDSMPLPQGAQPVATISGGRLHLPAFGIGLYHAKKG